MDIRTKIISTIIAMVCSISVSATGIVAILLEFPISVANSTSINAAWAEGDLWGTRFGTSDYPDGLSAQLLYKRGEGMQKDNYDKFIKDVSFAPGSKQIEYLLLFKVAKDAENPATFIVLESTGLTNNSLYKDDYKIGYGIAEPSWETAETITVGKTYVADIENSVVWLRATLTVQQDTYDRLNTDATWSFVFSFTGAAVEN